MIRVKICGVQNEKDIEIAVDAGADAVGFLVGQVHVSPYFILPGTASRLAAALPPYIQPVLVTHYTDVDEITELLERTKIQTIQLHGGSKPEEVGIIRDRFPHAKIIVAAHLMDERKILELMDFYALADAILLDSILPEERKVGGTGKTCDWNLASDFVANAPVPVILAGGLCPDNVEEAISKVRPFGVDANSRLKTPEGELDAALCREFCRKAKSLDF